MKNKIILHIDMNSYFASVEQQANPFLRGKSVGVCAYLSPGGCIIASSVEAKAKGIKTGCRVRDALLLDPNVVLLENEPAKYRSTTEKIFSILKKYSDKFEPYSIDEAFLDLSGWVKDFSGAEKIGREIQKRIKKEIGPWLDSSVGISWTKFLAKFASDIAPKKSVLLIDRPAKLEELLKERGLKEAWGINTRLEARLKALGINDLLELKNYSQEKIRSFLGKYGYYLWANVNGLEISSVSSDKVSPKSIGHSYCLPKKTVDKKYLSAVLYKLCEKTGRRLRAHNLEAQNISLGWSFAFLGGFNKSFKTRDKMFTTEEIFKYAAKELEAAFLPEPVKRLAVSISRLTPVGKQMSLFFGNLKKKELSRAMDRLNDKYGEYTVFKGCLFGAEDAAKDRIGFRKTPEAEF